MAFTVTSPKQWQIVQRSGSSASVTIAGNVGGGTHNLEYSLDGGSFTALLASQTGAYTTTLSIGQGVHRITVRPTDAVQNYVTIDNFGVGELFILPGQSNAVGQINGKQFYRDFVGRLEGLNPWCSIFGGDYNWHQLSDPVDGDLWGWVDAVNDPGGNTSSIWPLVATNLVANQNVPFGFIPGAKDGSGIDAWLPAADHQDRTTHYGAMTYRALQVSATYRGALWWQGEIDALSGMSAADYQSKITTIATAWNSDLGLKMIPVLLQQASGYTNANRLKIVAGIQAAIAANPSLFGVAADFQNLVADDPFHLTTVVNAQGAATDFANVPMATAIKNSFGW